jgi:hypothetical protein
VGVWPVDSETTSHAALKGAPEIDAEKFNADGELCTCNVCAAGSAALPSW